MNGNFLKEKLQSFDIQLVELAKKLQISPQTLQSRFKTKDVTINFLIEICSAINKSPYQFLEGSVYEKILFSENLNHSEENKSLQIQEPIAGNLNDKMKLIELLEEQILELKRDKEELKKDKTLLTSLIETKLGNQAAS